MIPDVAHGGRSEPNAAGLCAECGFSGRSVCNNSALHRSLAPPTLGPVAVMRVPFFTCPSFVRKRSLKKGDRFLEGSLCREAERERES